MDTVMMSDGIEVCTVFILVFLLNYFQVTTSFVLWPSWSITPNSG